MIQELINRYKRMRTERFLRQTFQYKYAFVGMGQHSLTNLYPVLQYLGVPLKFICVTSQRKAQLIKQKYPYVKTTTSLDEILKDSDVKGVFVSASPSAHFSIAKQVLQSGKSLFIEKPPCHLLAELDSLIELQQKYGSPVAMVGMQKRNAPAILALKKRLKKEHLISYDLHYLTGAYPDGNALLDLYIHPLDLVTHLFGNPEILACQHITPTSYLIILHHSQIVGTLELSTDYTWNTAEEYIKVCTTSGIYRMSQMVDLTYEPNSFSFGNIPFEKICPCNKNKEYIYHCDNFIPTPENNTIYSQGYYNEILIFLKAVERSNNNMDISLNLHSLLNTYHLLQKISHF